MKACGSTAEEDHHARKSQRLARLDLSLGHVADRTGQDLDLIGGGVQSEGEQRAVPRVTQEPPQADILKERPEGTDAVIDQEHLCDQRRAAKEIDISRRHTAEIGVLRQPPERHRQRDDRAHNHRDDDELDRDDEAFNILEAVLLHEFRVIGSDEEQDQSKREQDPEAHQRVTGDTREGLGPRSGACGRRGDVYGFGVDAHRLIFPRRAQLSMRVNPMEEMADRGR